MSSSSSSWWDWMLGAETLGSGEGIERALRGTWYLPPWLSVLLALGAIALVAWCYARERGTAQRGSRVALSLLRIAALAIVAFMLAQFVITQSRTGLPYVVVMVDDSASMGIEDRYDDTPLRDAVSQHLKAAALDGNSRFNQARSLLLEHDARLLRAIDSHYKLKVYFASDVARADSGNLDEVIANVRNHSADGTTTRLGQGIRQVLNDLRGTPPSALVLITDGINTEGESLSEAATYARRKGVPLFMVAIGSQTPVRDLELSDLLVDEVVFVDDVVNFECKLTGTGLAGRTVQVVLRLKDNPAPLAAATAVIGADGKPQKIRIPYRPTTVGPHDFVVEVRPLAEEVNADNNAVERMVTVRKEQIRTLLVQAYPNFEFRYLKHMLQRDNTVMLRSVLQEADLDYSETDQVALRTFPVRREELLEYDVVIFGDVDPSFFSASAAENLVAFVTERGGGVVFIAGTHYTPDTFRDTPIAGLIPIDFSTPGNASSGVTVDQGFQVEPTELGLAMPTMQLGDTPDETVEIWRNLPPLYWLYEAPALKPGARLLAQARTNDRLLPAIALQYVGAGKVLLHTMDATWRWRWRVGDVYFARYWVQTLRYLARSKLLGADHQAELSVDRREYRRGESARLRVRFVDERAAPADDAGVVVMIEHEGNPNRRVTLTRNASHRGIFEGLLPKLADGKYHAWITAPAIEGSGASADFRVVAPPGEFERVQMDLAEMKRAASETRGHLYTMADAARLLDDLPAGEAVPVESLPPKVLWNHWLVLLALVVVLTGEWTLRKRQGML
ncbi:MAG TPA: VWA domain-containing protein [Pirellulales bacterium]|nr:VWA domain-containing protein [Pirellulales bacterium]